MDFIQDYLAHHLPQAYRVYKTYSPYLIPIYRYLLLTQSYFYRHIFPTLYPFYTLSNNALRSISTDTPDLPTLLILAAALILSLKVLDYMRKTVIYWIGLATKMVMWVLVMGLGFYVWQRGLEQSVVDFGWIWGLFAGLGERGERIGGAKAERREWEARRVARAGTKGRTRGAGW